MRTGWKQTDIQERFMINSLEAVSKCNDNNLARVCVDITGLIEQVYKMARTTMQEEGSEMSFCHYHEKIESKLQLLGNLIEERGLDVKYINIPEISAIIESSRECFAGVNTASCIQKILKDVRGVFARKVMAIVGQLKVQQEKKIEGLSLVA